jgi:hypothetical protein
MPPLRHFLAGDSPLRIKHLLAAGAFAVSAFATLPAAAQTCAGFADMPVATYGAFCPSVEWMKNRLITTGCGDGTVYCPENNVTRVQMAAFLKRLEDAVTPTFQRKRDAALGALNFVGQQNLCATDAVAINGYPRSAIVRGLVNLYTPDGGMDIRTWVVYSIDGGTTWVPTFQNATDGFAYGALYAGHTPPNDISLHPMNVIDLNVGTSYRFALATTRATGIGQIANAYCENLVQLVNRNGSSSPFDAATDTGPPGRGD